MAWVLRKKDSNEELKLLANREYIVGRKEVDIVLSNDQSISRKHAILTVSHLESNISRPSNIPIVKLMDTSKYGTSVNGEKIDKNGVIINSGDTVLFGILENYWSLEYKPFVCTSSFLQKAERTLVRQCLTKVGGHMVPEWTSECNLLVMTQLNMSIKVVNALASLCHIVTAKFLEDYLDAVEKRSDEPNYKQYSPPRAEPLLREDEGSFTPNVLRRSVFSGLKFFCISPKQLKKLQLSIEMGGGKASLIQSCKESLSILLKDERICVLQPSNEELKEEFIKTLTSHLDNHSLRYISEAEIGMAILHCSTDKFCNPKGSGDKEYLLQHFQSQSLSSSQFENFSSASSEPMELLEQVKMKSCETDNGSSNFDQGSLENDPFLKDTLEYSANRGPQKFNRNTKFIETEKSPEKGLMNSHPAPSRLSPDMFGDIGSFTTRTITRTDDSSFAPCTSGIQRKRNILRDEKRIRKDDDVNSDNENKSQKMSSCSKRNRQMAQSFTEGVLQPEDKPNLVRKRCKDVVQSTPAGFLSARNLPLVKTEDISNDLETSHIIIKFKPLIRKRSKEDAVLPVSNGLTRKNFKKFKKVLPKNGSASGRIVSFRSINGLTSAVQGSNSNQVSGEPLHSSPNYYQSQSAGLFDWPTHLKN